MKKILTNMEEILTGIALCTMTVLTVLNVFCRLFLGRSFTWADKITYIGYAYVIFVGASSLYKRFGHSAIDLVVRMFPEKIQAVCAVFSTTVLTLTNGLCFVLSCGYCASSWTRRTQLLKIPYSVESFALVLGFGLMLVHSIMFLKNVVTKKDYFHQIPIYQEIYNVDALQDQIDAGLEHQREKADKGGNDGCRI